MSWVRFGHQISGALFRLQQCAGQGWWTYVGQISTKSGDILKDRETLIYIIYFTINYFTAIIMEDRVGLIGLLLSFLGIMCQFLETSYYLGTIYYI